jgi:predicted RNA-binding protein YlxR (DUF448 family)
MKVGIIRTSAICKETQKRKKLLRCAEFKSLEVNISEIITTLI